MNRASSANKLKKSKSKQSKSRLAAKESKSKQSKSRLPAKESKSKNALNSAAATARKTISSKGKMRVRLPGIESFEKELEFVCDGPSRVVVRLERLMGSSRARINDARYMGALLKKLEEEELEIWGNRKKLRKKKEKDRFRQLIIEGKIEPKPGDLASREICSHPIYRVNRLLNRINDLNDSMSPIVPNKISPKIVPNEPFHEKEYLECGILFGFHKNHYRRTQTAAASLASLERDQVELETFLPPTFTGVSEEHESDSDEEKENLETELEDEEWGGEDYMAQNRRSFLSTIFGNSKSQVASHCDIQALFKRGSIERAQQHCGIGVKQNLDKWKVKQSPLIDQLFQNEEQKAMDMYEFSKNLLEAYQREQIAMDTFVSKSYRKYF